MKGFLTRGCNIILPERGGTLNLPRGATPAARWPYEPQPISDQRIGVGFRHRARDGIDPGDRGFRPRVVGVAYIWKRFRPGMGPYLPRVRRDLDVAEWETFRGALAL